jgi:predicted XRE-type DNA-binding protein
MGSWRAAGCSRLSKGRADRNRARPSVQSETEMGRTTTGEPEKFVKGSGNVFADLRLPNADELAVETELLRRIVDCLRARGLSQRQAARILGIDQPKVSALMRGRVEGFP